MKYRHFISLCLLVLLAHTGFSQNWKVSKVEIPDPQLATGNYFGFAMDADSTGGTVVVGAINENAGAYESGAAYIYEYQNDAYQLVKKLVPDDPSEDKSFGQSVGISDSLVVIGAPFDRTETWSGGSVYVFKKGKNGWQDARQIERIVPTDLQQYAKFGIAVAIKENTIAIGSAKNGDQKEGAEIVYVYEMINQYKDTKLKAKLRVKKPSNTQYTYPSAFGASLSIGDNFIAVGDPYSDTVSSDGGAIFIFNKPEEGWKDAFESEVLRLNEEIDQADIGRSISIWGDILITGGRRWVRESKDFRRYGYLFQKDEKGWKSVYPIAALELKENSRGTNDYSVTIQSDYAAISSPMYNDSTGGVYIFKKPGAGWVDATENRRIVPEDLKESSYFGESVLLLPDRLLIGAPNDKQPDMAPGSVFELSTQHNDWLTNNLKRWETPRELDASKYIFGEDVAIYGNTMVVGAPRDRLNGAAYVYEKVQGKWQKTAKLTASDGKDRDFFGASVSIFKDDIIIGAPYVDDERRKEAGAAYIFSKPKTGWQDMHETAKFFSSDADGNFGTSVDLNQDFAAVGIEPYGSDGGGVYIFEKKDGQWVSGTETLHIPPQAVNGDLLGYKVDCNATGVLASAPLSNKLYFFEKTGDHWNIDNPVVFELSKLGLAHAVTKSFHLSVNVSKEFAVIGWPYAVRENLWGAGEVYLFRRINGVWKQEPTVIGAPTSQANQFFGVDVSIDNDLLLVGANGGYNNDEKARQPGAAYVYARSGNEWKLVHELKAAHPKKGDRFGTSVSIVGNNFAIGSPHDTNETGYRAGAVYIFNPQGPWVEKVTSLQKDGWYGIGQEILIDILYDDSIWVQGTPTLTLLLDAGTRKIPYYRGSGSSTLTFRYVVTEGDTSPDLAYNDVFALSGDIFGRDSVKANQLLPHPGRTNSLKGHKDISIDGIRPVLSDSLTVSDTTNQSEVAIYWKSNEAIHQVNPSQIYVNQGVLASWQLRDSHTIITQIRPRLGKVNVELRQGAVLDKANNAALALAATFWYDSVAPRLTLQGNYAKDTTILSVKLQFSEKVVGFSKTNILLNNGLLQTFQKENDSTYSLQIYSDYPKTLTIDLNATTITDKAGNKLRKGQGWPVKGLYFFQLTSPDHLLAGIDSSWHTVLTWQDASTNSIGYIVHRSLTDDFIRYDSLILTTSEKYYVDTALLSRPEAVFYFRVAGYNFAGQSGFSNIAKIDHSLYPPHGLRYRFANHRQLLLGWQDVSKAEEGFIIERATSQEFQHIDRYTVAANTTFFADTAMDHTVPGYWYRVRAFSQMDTTEASTSILVKMSLPPPTQTQATLSGQTVALSWKDEADNESGYLIEKSVAGMSDHIIYLPENTETYLDHLTAAENDIYYRIAAYHALDTSEVITVQVNVVTALPAIQETLWSVYPNPIDNKGQVEIKIPYGGTIYYQVLSLQGDLIVNGALFKKDQSTSFALDVSRLSAGTYFLKIVWKDEAKTFKLIKI